MKLLAFMVLVAASVYYAGSAVIPEPSAIPEAPRVNYYAQSGDCKWYYATDKRGVIYSVMICSDGRRTVREL